METYKIIDVSEFQGNIDWAKVKASGIDGAIIRFGAGLDIVDSKFEYNVQQCINVGLHVGAYHFSWATTEEYAIKEADKFLDACSKYNFDLPLYYDIEQGTKNPRTTTAQMTTMAFINRCKERGYTVGVYANLTYFNNYLNVDVLKTSPLWIAQYKSGISKPEHKSPELFGMWQYTSSGKVDGVSGNVDLNFCYIPYWVNSDKKVVSELDWSKVENAVVQASMKAEELNKLCSVACSELNSIKDRFMRLAPTPQPAPTPQLLSVYQRQVFLKTFFYFYKGTVDGLDGPMTRQAIKEYQLSQGLTSDGVWGAKTEEASKSNARAVQQKLCDAGMRTDVDGIIGNDTIACLTRYQKAVGLQADGIMGVQTYRKLFNDPTYGATKSQSATSVNSSGNISPHFTKSEFRCGCGGKWCNGYNNVSVSPKLLYILEKIRAYYNRPIVITSGIRCQRYNDSLRGSIKNSVHRTGGAADIYIKGVTDNSTGRAKVKKLAYQYGAAYCYYGTSNMGNAVHINI